MEGLFREDIEVQRIDKFFCDEMGRQIHRYIKAMHGSLVMLHKFEAKVKTLAIPEREQAIAMYIDLNRRVIKDLDWRMLVARSIANFCDSYSYFLEMVNDKATVDFYVTRMQEKYIRFHEVFEENGKYGIRDHEGNILVSPSYDFLRTPYVYVDDLMTMPIIAEKNGKVGLILPDRQDTVVVPFEYDNISLRDEEPWFELCKGDHVELYPQSERVGA